MPENKHYPPEGVIPFPVYTLSELKDAKNEHTILEGIVHHCDPAQNLHLYFGKIHGIIPRHEVVAPWISGSSRDISVLSRVGKQSCFIVKNIFADEKGAPVAMFSRRDAQETAMEYFMEHLQPGMILSCKVIRLESFAAFLDIGCGIVALLPIERISLSRINHPKDRFQEGDRILAAVLSIDREHRRITMTHRELLGTWMENASRFRAGESVRGIVRSIQDYGCFIELAPNLSGLADPRSEIQTGDNVSVFIKSIRPEKMKIKLQIIDRLPEPKRPEPPVYQITDGKIDQWVYSPSNCEKGPIITDFTAVCP